MEPPKMTETEIVGLVAEAASWVNQMREQYRPLATSLDQSQKTKMRPFFPQLGVERFMELDVRGLNKKGSYILISLVKQAYELDSRFTKDPSDIFSVAEEVQQWAQSGRYER
jgi:hypothetical protein